MGHAKRSYSQQAEQSFFVATAGTVGLPSSSEMCACTSILHLLSVVGKRGIHFLDKSAELNTAIPHSLDTCWEGLSARRKEWPATFVAGYAHIAAHHLQPPIYRNIGGCMRGRQ